MAECGESNNDAHTPIAGGSELVFDFYCEVCRDDDKHLEAAGFCVDCGEYLCGPCVTSHKRARPSRYHNIQDQSEMPKNTPLSQYRISKNIHTTCCVHGGESVKYYCKTHDEFGCSSCFVTGHRDCSEITPILQVTDNFLDDTEFKYFMETLSGTQQKVTTLIEQAHGNISHLERCCVDAIREVKCFRQDINAVLDGLELHFIGIVEDATAEEIGVVESFERELQEVYEKIETISTEVDHLLKSRRVCQLFVTMKHSENKIAALSKDLQSAEERGVRKSVRFKPSRSLSALLNKEDAFGKVWVNHSATPPKKNLNRDTWTGYPEVRLAMQLEPIGFSGGGRKQRTRNKKHSYKTNIEFS